MIICMKYIKFKSSSLLIFFKLNPPIILMNLSYIKDEPISISFRIICSDYGPCCIFYLIFKAQMSWANSSQNPCKFHLYQLNKVMATDNIFQKNK